MASMAQLAIALIAVAISVFAYLMGRADGAREASRNHVITCNTVTVVAVENGIRARCDND